MKKNLLLLLTVFFVLSLFSCVKDRNTINTDFGPLKPFLELRSPDFPGAGTPNFAGIDHFDNADIDVLTLFNDTILFYVNLASQNTFNAKINVTVGLDENLIKAFNDTSAVKYTVLPPFAYKQLNKDVVIEPNERVAKVRVVFKKDVFDQLDPTVDYMLPLTILKNDGISVSSNEGTVWFHKIGNCIAGTYDAVGSPASPIFFTPKTMEPVNLTTATIEYGNQGPAGWKYVIVFNCTNNEIIGVSPNDFMYSRIEVNSFRLEQPPTYDPVKKEFHFVTSFVQFGTRKYVDETLTKQ